MDKEHNTTLKEGLAQWGYPLFKTERRFSPGFYLAELVENTDPRLQEGFPVVFANWLEKTIDDKTLEIEFNRFVEIIVTKKTNKNKLIIAWIALSVSLIQFYNMFEDYMKKLLHRFETEYKCKEILHYYKEALVNKLPEVYIGDKRISVQRIAKTFLNYVIERKGLERKSLFETLERRNEFETEFYLSVLFSKKQKEIIKKKLERKPLTKTEKEYYSRTIRKRLTAIAHSGIQAITHELTS